MRNIHENFDSVIDYLTYKSYASQREVWFDPAKCSKNILSMMKDIYPQLENYEKIITQQGV